MTIARLTKILTALTSSGIVDEDTEITLVIPDDSLTNEDYFSVMSVTVNNNGAVTVNGWVKET